jgi:hypothetical protein
MGRDFTCNDKSQIMVIKLYGMDIINDTLFMCRYLIIGSIQWPI